MTLKDYLDGLPRGGQSAMAKMLGIAPAYLYQMANGMRPISAERCPQIERLTDGAVRCEDLRPDVDWAVLRGHKTDEAAA
jgi:DNA-binding transcriptional regulator YdaS (Cro superfamily)